MSRHTSSLGEDAGIQPGPSNFTSGSIAFAPNVTPGTYNDPPPPFSSTDPLPDSLLFPADGPSTSESSSTTKSPTTAHGRKKPASHIPRPPNAFILFRSSFIRSRHVSTGVETNHSTLSKIIGLTWQNLPEEERQVWHRKAKQAEAEHRAKFPAYAFKPLHGRLKAGGGKRKVREVGPKDHVRCAKIAELLVKGLKGQELDEAIGEFDKSHVPEVITRFEQPITESSFECESRPASAPIPDLERKREREATPVRKLRCASSPSSSTRGGSLRRSTLITNTHLRGASPALSVASSLASSFDLEQLHSSQPHQMFAMPPLDNNFPFEQMKHDPSYDFTLFSFDPSMQAQTHPPMHSFGFDPHPHPHPSDSAYPSSHPLPQFHLDASYITPTECNHSSSPHSSPHDNNATTTTHSANNWLPCSPSTNTNGSMPVTPVYPGSLPLPALQEDNTGYAGYYGEAPPAYHTLHQGKMPRLEAPVAQYGVGVGYEELAGYGQY